MDNIIRSQLKKIGKKEKKLLEKNKKGAVRAVSEKMEDKIPKGVKEKLETAFYKGFSLVFSKGTGWIEKTYNKEKRILEYEAEDYTYETDQKRVIKQLNKVSSRSSMSNLGLTALEGTVMGALGIGLADIPVFIGVLLKGIYEVAISYGFSYEEEEEKYYILLMIEAALAHKETQKQLDDRVNEITEYLSQGIQVPYLVEDQMRLTADAMAEDMLCMKFIQGIPIIGVLGGAVNVSYFNRVLRYVKLKYRKRYLLSKN